MTVTIVWMSGRIGERNAGAHERKPCTLLLKRSFAVSVKDGLAIAG